MYKTTFHTGRLSGTGPPQEYLSLGGMTTLPGYADDSFVNTHMALNRNALYVCVSNWVDERSRWAPVRLILTFDAGTVWGYGEKMKNSDVKLDAGFELDYMETLRLGVVWPVDAADSDSPRIYIGWGVHVF